MSTVLAEMSMSLDGYVADLNDGVTSFMPGTETATSKRCRAWPDSRFTPRRGAPRSCAMPWRAPAR